MKTKIYIQLVLVLFFFFNTIQAVAGNTLSSTHSPAVKDLQEMSYIRLEFKDFPFLILLTIKKLAPSLKGAMPADLDIGLKDAEGQGKLIFSYNREGELVHLRMLLVQTVHDVGTHAAVESISALSLERSIRNPPSDMVADTLKDFFISFCDTWESNRLFSSVDG